MKVEKIKIVDFKESSKIVEENNVSISINRDYWKMLNLAIMDHYGNHIIDVIEHPILHEISKDLMTFTGLFKGKIVFVYVWTYDR